MAAIPAAFLVFLIIAGLGHVSADTNQTIGANQTNQTNFMPSNNFSGNTYGGNQSQTLMFNAEGYRTYNATSHFKLLMANANREGKIRVIVKLNMPFVPEGNMKSPQSIMNQRLLINQTQGLLLKSLLSYNIGHVRAFRYIPFVAMEVDNTTLHQLNSSALVSDVYQDRLHHPLDVDTIPLTGTENAWNLGYDGTGQTIAILDTGVDKTHPFLTGKVVSEACFSTPINPSDVSLCPDSQTSQTGSGAAVPCSSSLSECFHGTFVAGIAAGNSATYLPGFARGADIIAVQVFHEDNTASDCTPSSTPCVVASDSDIISGLEYVYSLRDTYEIAAVNLSLGGDGYTSQSSCDADNSEYESEFGTLLSAEIAPVVASGNDGSSDSIEAPACVSGAISVGSTNDSDQVSSFTDSASFLSLLAPGESVTSSVPGGGISTDSGTSFATPAVSGAFAILREKDPLAPDSTILSALQTTGKSITSSRGTFARIEVDLALQSISCSPPSSGDWTIPSSCSISSTVTAPANVIVEAGSVLTIPDGDVLRINFESYHLLVKSGGGVLIKAGGAIN